MSRRKADHWSSPTGRSVRVKLRVSDPEFYLELVQKDSKAWNNQINDWKVRKWEIVQVSTDIRSGFVSDFDHDWSMSWIAWAGVVYLLTGSVSECRDCHTQWILFGVLPLILFYSSNFVHHKAVMWKVHLAVCSVDGSSKHCLLKSCLQLSSNLTQVPVYRALCAFFE